MSFVVGTAGHIDHGKTTLLRALTGIDPDRLPEERARGMTIDVGYAHLTLDDGSVIDFVDVPGHDRLIGNMLVGAGEVDAGLLVVAADDGPRAQTVEHLELIDALGIDRAVVALTKTDAVEPVRLAVTAALVRRMLAPTALAGAPIVPVSGVTGGGIDTLRTAIAALARADRPDAAPGPRLAIDRVFSVRGRGAVVTGTLRGGSIAAGDRLVLQPGGREVRVREVQVHGRPVARSAGGRTALNLAAIPAAELRRGQVLTGHGAVEASDRLLVALRRVAAVRETVPPLPADRARVRLHLGTDQVDARVGRSGREAIELVDGRVTALLRLDRPIAVAAGDQFVLRRTSPGVTAAGGVVVDPAPARGASRRRANPARIAAAVAAPRDRAARLALHGALVTGRHVDLAPDVDDTARVAALQLVADHAAAHPVGPGMRLAELRAEVGTRLRREVGVGAAGATSAGEQVVAALVGEGRLEQVGDRVLEAGRRVIGPSDAQIEAMDRLVALLDVPAPPSLAAAARAAGCSEDAVSALDRDGRIVRLGPDLAWATAAWERLARQALDAATTRPLLPAALRDATGTSRKYVLPLLEDLDRRGILTRTPAGHVPGPRAALLRAEPIA
jgi:selenocysteine-specific elongation factor